MENNNNIVNDIERIVKDWVEAQMAILESGMVKLDQIFLPYIMDSDGRTVYELYESKQLLLSGWKE